MCDVADLTLVLCSGKVGLSSSPKVDHGGSRQEPANVLLLRAKLYFRCESHCPFCCFCFFFVFLFLSPFPLLLLPFTSVKIQKHS